MPMRLRREDAESCGSKACIRGKEISRVIPESGTPEPFGVMVGVSPRGIDGDW